MLGKCTNCGKLLGLLSNDGICSECEKIKNQKNKNTVGGIIGIGVALLAALGVAEKVNGGKADGDYHDM